MWPDKHVADTNPLMKGCTCYTCRTFHRAYIRHLLNAKEMLAWTLLHVHNLHVMDQFFASVRRSIARGTFEEDARTFAATYQSEMPEQTGQGPRLRGYQFKTEKGDTRKNDRVYGRLDAVAAAGAN
ncbi:hypothetical protein KEM55_000341 [Ascosphaera atra]|nr:hypothetical protein KEM55_000341 [Ascosphaera atra]